VCHAAGALCAPVDIRTVDKTISTGDRFTCVNDHFPHDASSLWPPDLLATPQAGSLMIVLRAHKAPWPRYWSARRSCCIPGLRLEEFGRAVAASHGDVDVVVRGDVAVGGGGAGEAGQIDGVDADVAIIRHSSGPGIADVGGDSESAANTPESPFWAVGRESEPARS
jgi:hypothetical protein